MTDQQLSERVCRALGIEPLEWQVIDSFGYVLAHHRREKDINEWLAHNQNDPEFGSYRKRAVYPSVLDWPGFGRVVERLRGNELIEVEMVVPFKTKPRVRIRRFAKTEAFYGTADTLPRALALAVVAWEASR